MDNRVNILYIGFFSLPDKDAAAHRVMNNAKVLRDLGYNVIFLDEQNEYPYSSIIESKRIINGFTVFSVKRPQNVYEWLNKMLTASSIEEILNTYSKIDYIIAYNYPSIALETIRRKHCKNIKIISDATEWYSGKEYKFPLSILASIDSWYRMKIVNKKLDGIICISKYLNNYYKKSNKTVLIPPLVDINEDIWHQDIRYDHDMINLIYSGSPARDKDKLKPIIQAITREKYRKKFVLRIVGISKMNYLKLHPDIETIIKDNVLFEGRVDHKRSVQLLKSSDFLTFFREQNRVSMAGFSTKFVEAVTCGIGIITNNTSNLKDYVFNLPNVYILDDVNSIEKTLEYIIENKVETKCKVCNSIFDYHSYKKEFENFFKII